ncbi:opioid growth factor receptor-related protein [Halomonas sp. Bachu 37]|uniref:opioid growth factor receptor-related protein n=1 Tax=Halomonas kashgarensis TaxID=3084920 RepID=UPI00321699B6
MSEHAERLMAFYLNHATDHQGRTLEDIWELSHFWLEHTHDYIQWLFPIPEAGRFNPFAPLLDEEARRQFHESPTMQARQRTSLDVMLDFFGLQREGLVISATAGLDPTRHIWLKRGGHNHLRITRIIRSLHLAGQPELAGAVQQSFIDIGTRQGYVTPATVAYWQAATQAP